MANIYKSPTLDIKEMQIKANWVPLHPCQNDYYEEIKQQQILVKMWE
jgi:hypothetical protein